MKRDDGQFPYLDYWVYFEYSKQIERDIAVLVHKVTYKKTSMSWARYIKSVAERRILHKSEHVDHIDDNPNNDDLSNLQILTQAENIKKYWNSPGAAHKRTSFVTLECFYCHKKFERDARRIISANRVFCSKRCSAKQGVRF